MADETAVSITYAVHAEWIILCQNLTRATKTRRKRIVFVTDIEQIYWEQILFKSAVTAVNILLRYNTRYFSTHLRPISHTILALCIKHFVQALGGLCKHTHTLFNGPLSGTTRAGQYQKKQSPSQTLPDIQTSFINFAHLLRSIASSLFNLQALCEEPMKTSIHSSHSDTTLLEGVKVKLVV